jgi:hypothetical protein
MACSAMSGTRPDGCGQRRRAIPVHGVSRPFSVAAGGERIHGDVIGLTAIDRTFDSGTARMTAKNAYNSVGGTPIGLCRPQIASNTVFAFDGTVSRIGAIKVDIGATRAPAATA